MYLSLTNLLKKLEAYRQMTAQEQLHKIMSGSSKLLDDDSKFEGSPTILLADIVVSFIFLFAELVAVVYAIKMAVKCTRGESPERTVNLLIAVVHPIPYLLFNMLLNPCAKSVLQTW